MVIVLQLINIITKVLISIANRELVNMLLVTDTYYLQVNQLKQQFIKVLIHNIIMVISIKD